MELTNQAEVKIGGDVVQLAEERFARRLAETVAAVETRLTARIAAVETRVIRWTFALWLTVLAVLVAFFAFVKP